jgi:hypothetical protein
MDSSKLGAIIVSIVVLTGFILLSFLAMKPESAGVKYEIVLVLLGNWSGLAFAVTGYWVGSTISSKQKDDTIASISTEKKP